MKRASLRCDAVQISAPSADQTAGTFRAGRWRLNAGSRMLMCIDGVNEDSRGNPQPVGVILDMETLELPERIPALVDHDDQRIVGTWENLKVENGALVGDLVLVDPVDEREAAAMPDAVRAKALIRAKVPMQASIGADADYDDIEVGQIINGQPFQAADDDAPTVAARHAQFKESSIVLRGADARTGQIAASAAKPPKSKDFPMSLDLKTIKAKYAGKSAEIRAAALEKALEDGATELSVAEAIHDLELKAATAERDSLQAKLKESEKNKPGLLAASASTEATVLPGASSAAGTGTEGAPKTWLDARRLVASENPKLKGAALNAAVEAKFPNLKASDIAFKCSLSN